jgi:uncharacterized protein YqgC (DUF456 family)
MNVPLVLALALMAVGLVGTVVPALPGIVLVFGGVLVYAVATGFEVVNWGHVALFGALTAVALGLDLVANLVGARLCGASRWGILGAVIGVVVGLFVGGPVGLVLGPLVGAVALEALSGRPLGLAVRSGFGVLVGYVLGTAAELVLALVIVISFLRLTLA